MTQAEKPERQTRRGVVVYNANPFLETRSVPTKSGVRKIIGSNHQLMVIDSGTGEEIGPGGFYTEKAIDKTQFVKLYVNGVKALKELTGAGTKVFEILYLEVQKNIGTDRVLMSYDLINQDITPLSRSTYMRGMRELMDKGFVAASIVQNLYFVNPDFIWNGDRLAFVQMYYKKPVDERKIDTKTLDLFEQPAR